MMAEDARSNHGIRPDCWKYAIEPDLAAHGVSCDQNTRDVGISR